MQALHVSGQTNELRDPLPVKDLARGEVDNSEHPFMKLLAGLRDAMKQGDEAARNVLEDKSRLNQDASSKLKSMKDSTRMTVAGQERSEGTPMDDSGLQGTAVLGVRNGSAKVLEGRGQEESAVRKSGQADFDGRSLSYIPGGNAAPKSSEPGALAKAAGSGSGKVPELLADGTLNQNAALIDKHTLSDSGDSALESKRSRNPESAAEGSSRHRNLAATGNLDRTSLAASGSLNGSMSPVGLNRSDNLAASMDKSSLDKPVDGARSSDRRPTRYSVVDMRLKAIAGKASQDTSAEGKPEGKPGGSTGSELNRSGLSGTDAAGRQIRNDQAAGGFSEAVKGSRAEVNDKGPASLADNLAARLRDGGAMDIVRSAQIVLKDGDAGLIRLRLEPESLGGVKIELKMADKQISARIIVESDLAGEAFRSSLDSLREAFASSGFETTSIEVEVRDGRAGSGNAGRDDSGNDNENEGNGPYMARKAGELGDAVPSADPAYGRYGVIDLVV